MQKSRIDWPWKPLWTWNPVSGCLHGCSYCYARKIANRFPDNFGGPGFKPTFHADRMNEPAEHKKPLNIFVGSMADLWGHWVPHPWISAVLESCRKAPQHTYIFLTKNPKRYLDFLMYFDFLDNVHLGYTMTGDVRKTEYVDAIVRLHWIGCKTFLSAEPLLGAFNHMTFSLRHAFDLVIVGAMSGPGAVPVKPEWVKSIRHPNIYLKNSIRGEK